jgi:4-hydroxyphenylpyruvate dioxygenase
MTNHSIATVSLSGPLDEKLRAIADSGFAAVEIFEADFLSFNGSPRDVRRLCADLGLTISAFQPFRDFEGMPEPLRGRNFERAARKFDLMQELGAELLLVCSNVSPASLGGVDRAAADFRELGALAATRGLRVGFEALAWGRHVNDYRDAWEVVRRADHPAIGLILDSFHVLARNTALEAIRAIPGDRIFLVQLADAPRFDLDVLSWSRHFRCFPGQGDLPVVDFMKAVEATGYRGPLSLEIFNDQFRAGSAARVARDGARSLIALEDRLDASRLSRRAATQGFGFIEFAVDEGAARELGALFHTLGFRKSGRHRSKAVERWSQGDINLVINAEVDGFAHSHYITHGPGVCAVGIDTADVGRTMARAEALRADSFRQKVGHGELEIPAIRGVGGSLLYFLEREGPLGEVWEREFTPTVDSAHAGRLTRVDHIAQSMPYDEMLSWLLFYEAIFDLKRLPQQDIADPAGLVQSQALANSADAVRIVLNGSAAARTLSARFLSEFFGSGVQHIAFSTEDIFAAVAEMRARGLTFLDIPANYYDDLEAKYSFDPATIAAMRAQHILYDRDENGEFFQIYTHMFADRFFFEIVERRNYRGFGAVNAPIRLAAQTRESRPVTMPRS